MAKSLVDLKAKKAERLVRDHWHLVEVTVKRAQHQLTASDREEVESAGYLALAQAAMKYDPAKGAASFQTYAITAIKWATWTAVLECRAGAFGRRGIEKWADRDQLPPCVSLLAAAPGKEGPDSDRTFQDVIADPGAGVVDTLLEKETRQDLWRVVERVLPPDQRAVIRAYYIEGKVFRQIAEERGIKQDRVITLHRNALKRLQGSVPRRLRN